MKNYRIGNLIVSVVKDGSISAENNIAETPELVADIIKKFIPCDDKEHFIALFVNTRNKIIGINEVSVGTISASLVHPRELFRPAILAGAACIIIAHNHPSGDISPSLEDKETTKRIAKAAEIIGIRLLDHVIIGNPEGYYSFKENGLI